MKLLLELSIAVQVISLQQRDSTKVNIYVHDQAGFDREAAGSSDRRSANLINALLLLVLLQS